MDEEERRRRAIAALRKDRRPGDVYAEFGRSREWLAKWQRRFAQAGSAGLREQSRAPHHSAPRGG
ncbi:MAG: helix-turn-helix domain-containing protein [Chloroflexota bacterium]|nr:helix-turn-helix domain-containing protein [Chloroflexota bacterium]